jgi:hypothetical protein
MSEKVLSLKKHFEELAGTLIFFRAETEVNHIDIVCIISYIDWISLGVLGVRGLT